MHPCPSPIHLQQLRDASIAKFWLNDAVNCGGCRIPPTPTHSTPRANICPHAYQVIQLSSGITGAGQGKGRLVCASVTQHPYPMERCCVRCMCYGTCFPPAHRHILT